ncbi:MAG: zinc-ribbon domain-containing protein [Ruminococcaceae bacterium]|nr:zinc-ribbon domain-containing protein [Oscillospiraceae bacterium]
MFCTKCGANLPETAQFCTTCGNPIENANAAPAPTPAPAPAANPYAAPALGVDPFGMPAPEKISAKKRGIKKAQFLKTEASQQVKMVGMASLIIFAVAAVLILLSALNVSSAPLWELPIVTMTVDEEEIDSMKEDLEESSADLDDAEDFLDEIEKEYGSDEAELMEEFIDVVREATDELSLNNVIAMLDYAEKAVEEMDDEVLEDMKLAESIESLEEVAGLFKVIRLIILGFAILVILLALWAAMGKRTGICILCMILYVPLCALMSSGVYAILILVALIALAVTTFMVNKAWKTA